MEEEGCVEEECFCDKERGGDDEGFDLGKGDRELPEEDEGDGDKGSGEEGF